MNGPTPQTVSRLLRASGFARGRAIEPRHPLDDRVPGFHVCEATRDGQPVVVVSWCPPPKQPGEPVGDGSDMLPRYADVLNGHGWLAEVRAHEVIVRESGHANGDI